MEIPRCSANGRRVVTSPSILTWLAVLGLAGLSLGGIPVAAAPFDFTSPVTTVGASPGINTVALEAFDPGTGSLVATSIVSGATSDLKVVSGVAAWSSGSIIYCYIYDPFRHIWAGTNVNAGGGSTFNLQTTNGVVAWTIGTTARYAAYDWTRAQWKTDSAAIGASANTLSVVDGIVAGASGSGVFYAAYDPRAGQWRKDAAAVGLSQAITLVNAGGLVAWSAGASLQGRAYDPLSGTWKPTTANLPANVTDLKGEGGVIAWVYTPPGGSLIVAYAAYDGPRAVWAAGSASTGYTTDLAINNSTVTWTTSSGSHRRGYNALGNAWTTGLPTPRAFFVASTNAANAPFTVAFIDLSVGGTAWSWSFGAGLGTSPRRSPLYRYTNFGLYFVTQTVTGPGGVSLTNGAVRTDLIQPSGTLRINDGAPITTNLHVALQLAATDNSGVVSEMRFSNDATTWSEWESYATAKPWLLAPGGGNKTVYGQFRDATGNVSTNSLDTILFDSTPSPTLTLTNMSIGESASSVVVTAVLSHPVNRIVSATCATSPGTAADGEDYLGQTTLIYFPSNTTTATFSLSLFPDTIVELDETIFLNLSNPTNAIVSGPGLVTILDDDLATVSMAAGNVTFGEEAGLAAVSVRLNAASSKTVSVRVRSQAGTATDSLDFTPVSTVLVFAPGQTTRTVDLPIADDLLDEFTETLTLRLSDITNAVIGVPAQSTVSILDNDQPIVGFSAEQYSGFEDEFSIAIHVRLSKSFSQQVSASYTIFGGTATPGIDYTVLGTVFIPPSTTNATITVFPINDPNRESDETIRLRLTDIAGASPGRTETTVNLLDEDGAPRFLSSRIESGTFRAALRGRADQTFTMQVTTNLTDWSALSNLTLSSGGTLEFSVPAAGSRRYFRTATSP